MAAGTVVLSWMFVQTVFAVHYTHVYYLEGEGGQYRRGLEFGDDEEPDYWGGASSCALAAAIAKQSQASLNLPSTISFVGHGYD